MYCTIVYQLTHNWPMQTTKIAVADQNAIGFYRMLKVIEQKKNGDKQKAAGKTPTYKV